LNSLEKIEYNVHEQLVLSGCGFGRRHYTRKKGVIALFVVKMAGTPEIEKV
jgi:hypothetical protein